MTCSYKGCTENKDIERIQIELSGGEDVRLSPRLCPHHRAEYLRELANEIEGVKICDHCGGTGITRWRVESKCCVCHGIGKVPKGI